MFRDHLEDDPHPPWHTCITRVIAVLVFLLPLPEMLKSGNRVAFELAAINS
jgi:hypothetical protein